MTADTKTCTSCGGPLREALPGLGSVCPRCVVRAAQTPTAITNPARHTTWAEVFPQLEVDELLRDDPEAPVYLARVLGDESSERVVLQVVSGGALRRAGGVGALQARAQRLAAADVDGMALVLDFGDLADAFFLVTAAPEGPTVPRAMAGRDTEEVAALLTVVAGEVESTVQAARATKLPLRFDPETTFVNEERGEVLVTPLLLVFGQSAPSEEASGPLELHAGRQIGSFELTAKVGEGGFGEVWRARQERPVKREVAVKILKGGLHSQRARARFHVEQQALAQLDHPGIAHFFEGGTTSDGRPYFAMEWIDGHAMVRFCEEHELDLGERLGLLRELCEAVQFAHQKGIIHRDLKSSNVMVAATGTGPKVKVIDFGIARAVEDPLTDGTLLTRAEELVGTPASMSPEQAAGAGGADLDARTDVYGLGVLLYELLTGDLPFDPQLPGDELRRRIREADPPRPSSRVDTSQRRRLRGDLDWITMRCLEKDPARRYRSANALLRDLERHANDEPVDAGPPELAYRARKFVRRNKVAVVAAALVALALCAGLVVSMLGLSRAREETRRAQLAEQKTEAALTDSRASNGFSKAELGKPAEAALWFAYAANEAKDPVRARQNKRRFLEWTRRLSIPIAAAHNGVTDSNDCFAQDLKFSPRDDLLRAMAFHGPRDDPERTVKLVALRADPGIEAVARDTYLAADFHPREAMVALVDQSGVLKLVNYEKQEVLMSQPLFRPAMTDLAFSHDGSMLAVSGVPRAGPDGFSIAVLRSGDLTRTADWLPLSGHEDQAGMRPYPAYLRWNADDRFLVAGIGADAVRSYAVDSVTLAVRSCHDAPLPAQSVFGPPRGLCRQLVSGVLPREGTSIILNTNPVIEWSLEDGRELRRFPLAHSNPLRGLAIAPALSSPGGAEEILACQGPNLTVFDREGTAVRRTMKAEHYFAGVLPSSDGASLFTNTYNVGVHRWNRQSADADAVRILPDETAKVAAFSCSASGDLLALARFDGYIQVWRNPEAKAAPDFYCPTALASAGEAGRRGSIGRWDDQWRWKDRVKNEIHHASTAWASVRPLVNCDSTVMVPIPFYNRRDAARTTAAWTLPDAKLLHAGFEGDGLLSAGVFSPVDPHLLVTGYSRGSAGHLAFWDVQTGEEVAGRIEVPGEPTGLAFAPGGNRLAVVCVNGEAVLITGLDGQPTVRELSGFVRENGRWDSVLGHGRITFSHNGKVVFTWAIDDSVRGWNGVTGEDLWTVCSEPVRGPSGNAGCNRAEVTKGGLFATAGGNGTIRWWNLTDGSPAPLPELPHPDSLRGFVLMPDGRRLVSVCRDHIARVWDIESGEIVSTMEGVHDGFDVALTRNGNIVSGSGTNGIRLWNPDTGEVLAPRLPTGTLRFIDTVTVNGREFALAGVGQGGVYGYDLNHWREYEDFGTDECLWLAELISSRTITGSATLTGLTNDDWMARMASLTEEQKAFLRGCFPRSRVAWHRMMSDLPEHKAIRDWHRERLRKLEPEVAAQLDRVEERRSVAVGIRKSLEAAMAAAENGEWAEAAEHFGSAVSEGYDGVETSTVFPAYPMVLAKLGDRERYFEASAHFVERFGDSEELYTLRMGARLYFGLPGAPDRELAERARDMARRAVEGAEAGSSDQHFGALALGLAELRIGGAAEAARWLEIAAGAPEDFVFCRIPAWAYGAMAAKRLGDGEKAAEWHRMAEEGMTELGPATGEAWMGHAWAEMAVEEARKEVEGK